MLRGLQKKTCGMLLRFMGQITHNLTRDKENVATLRNMQRLSIYNMFSTSNKKNHQVADRMPCAEFQRWAYRGFTTWPII